MLLPPPSHIIDKHNNITTEKCLLCYQFKHLNSPHMTAHASDNLFTLLRWDEMYIKALSISGKNSEVCVSMSLIFCAVD